MSFLSRLPEIHVSGSTGQGPCVLTRDGEEDVELSKLLRIGNLKAEVTVGSLPTVTLTLVGYRLIHDAEPK